MRNRLLLFAVLLCGSASFAQVSNYKTVGRNNVTQRDIVAFVHQFDGEIKKATIDTTSNTALITISDDPQAKREVCYDLVSQKKIWSKKLNNQETIVKFGDYFIYASPRTLWKQEKTYRLDGKSGEKKFMIGKGAEVVKCSNVSDELENISKTGRCVLEIEWGKTCATKIRYDIDLLKKQSCELIGVSMKNCNEKFLKVYYGRRK